MEKGNLQKLIVIYVIPTLKQQIYASFCQKLQIQMDCGKIERRS